LHFFPSNILPRSEYRQCGLQAQHKTVTCYGSYGPFAAGAELPTAALLRPIQWRLRALNDAKQLPHSSSINFENDVTRECSMKQPHSKPDGQISKVFFAVFRFAFVLSTISGQPLNADTVDVCRHFEPPTEFVDFTLIMQLEGTEVDLRVPLIFFEDRWKRVNGNTTTARYFSQQRHL
jgi:hypothetical protein